MKLTRIAILALIVAATMLSIPKHADASKAGGSSGTTGGSTGSTGH